jgi:cobalt-zinc-cadmium efflux system membrane fusion protein
MNLFKTLTEFVSAYMNSVSEARNKRFLVTARSFVILAFAFGLTSCKKAEEKPPEPPARSTVEKNFVDLTDKQSIAFVIKPVAVANFTAQFTAYGSIDFNGNASVQVFTPYQGKIIQTFLDLGDAVSKGQPLYTVDSPDLATAESALLSARGVFDLANATLSRAKELYAVRSISLKELEQNTSDQNAAEAALKAAREGVRIYGKSVAEIQKLESDKKIDSVLTVLSPINGQVVTRNAQPGLLVQPGNAPAPYVVADVVNKWLIINATEEDSTKLRVGQDLEVNVPVLPNESFRGRIKVIGSVVDQSTRTVLVRADISDPKKILRSGMYATYIVKGDSVIKSIGVPEEALAREGDGTSSIWVTEDGRRMFKRTVTLGLKSNGLVQITNGLKEGERVATTGAIFLSNMLEIDK